jgi:transposase-like protein
VLVIESGRSVKDVADKLGIHENTLGSRLSCRSGLSVKSCVMTMRKRRWTCLS